MKKKRTRRFRFTLRLVMGFSALFLFLLTVFGKQLAPQYFSLLTGSVFFVFVMAVSSFLAICFAPYFRGDKRWFAIPALLTALFFAGTVLLWRLPLPAGGVF